MADRTELARITAHYLEVIVRKAGLTGFDDMRAELMDAAEADASAFQAEIDRVEEKVDQPDWRQRS